MTYRVVSHRGDVTSAGENQVDAFRAAHGKKADAVELDVRINAEGSFVVIHDKGVARTTTSDGYIHQMSDDQIRALETNDGGYVPFLKRALTVIRDDCGGMEVMVELKKDAAEPDRWTSEKLGELRDLIVDDLSMGNRCIIISFVESYLRDFLVHGPQTRTLWIHSEPPSVEAASKFWGVAINADQCSPQYVDALRCEDTVVVQRNSNLTDDWRWMNQCGAWGGLTDDLSRMLSWRST